jgi:ketosteroid isomerase-like protein
MLPLAAPLAWLAMAAVAPDRHDGPQHASLSPQGREPAAIVDSFHEALGLNDTKTAAALLADDALIFESGGVERSKTEYAAHHLSADAEFARAVTSAITRRVARTEGSLAWVATEGRTTGRFRGKTINLATTETMVLRRVGTTWLIVHVHWSSAPQ